MNSDASPPKPDSFTKDDERWMRLALQQARCAQGRTGENPPVGCALISSDNRLVSVGHTARGGRPHAEAQAINAAKNNNQLHCLKGGRAYVTLEPCAHTGKTPPCVNAIWDAGISDVIYALRDPDPRVDGTGHMLLKLGGVDVQQGLYSDEAGAIMAGFLAHKGANKAFITTKIATSADGFVARQKGQQTWLTNSVSRVFVHDLRSRHDGVITGINTILSDDSELTCRLAGSVYDNPARLILDSHLKLPVDSKLCQTAKLNPVIVYCFEGAELEKRSRLEQAGVEIVEVRHEGQGLALKDIITDCLARGYAALLLEAGPILNQAFFDAGLIDKIIHIFAPENLETGYQSFASQQLCGNLPMAPGPFEDYICVENGVFDTDCWVIWLRQNAKIQDAKIQDAKIQDAKIQDAKTQDAKTQDAKT